MEEIKFLLSNYSSTEIIAILITVLLLVVAILRATSFIGEKIKQHFNIINEQDKGQGQLFSKVESIGEQIKDIQQTLKVVQDNASKRAARLEKVEKYVEQDYAREQEILDHNKKIEKVLNSVRTRLQEDTRGAFKDAYNYYYLREGKIDFNTLQALEKKYEYYKRDGGNSFVDVVMEKLRDLPLVEHMGEDVNDSA